MDLHSRQPTHWRCISQKGTSTWLEFLRHSTADRCMRDASQKDIEVAAGIEVVVVMDVCTPMHGREEGARGGGSGSPSRIAVNGIESAHGNPWMHWRCASRMSDALAMCFQMHLRCASRCKTAGCPMFNAVDVRCIGDAYFDRRPQRCARECGRCIGDASLEVVRCVGDAYFDRRQTAVR